MKKNQRKLLGLALAGVLTFGVFAIALGSYYTSKAYLFEKETGGHYLGEVDPEIQDIYAHKYVTPTDNYYSTQKSYSMNNVGNIESVWNEYKGNGVTVAVIDDGFDHDHPEFTRQGGGSVISNDSAYFYKDGSSYGVKYYSEDPTCIDEEWDIYENEWGTHGTNVSSTALAPMGNGGVVGIAPEATLLALKIDFSFVAIRAAINYAVSHGADVINMSLGAYAEVFEDGFGDTQNEGYTASDVSGIATYLNSACNNAYNNGVIVIAAAGNEATNHKSYPACNNHVIGVGALYRNSSTTLAPFTNYITGSEVGEKNVDILAPGFVYAAGVKGADQSSHTASYFNTQGTSFSSPIIAGAAALWKEKHPTGRPDEFEIALTQSAAGIGTYTDKMIQVSMYEGYDYDVGPSNFQGGRLDVASLMAFTNEATGITVSPSSHSMPKYQHRASTYNLTVNPVPSTAELPTINWSSSNTNVATVNSSGVVTAVGAGNATITAESTDGTMSSSSAITVYDYISPTGIQIANKNVSVEVGETYTINDASVVPANASDQDIIFISNDDNIATVNDDVITGVAVGSTTVTAYALDDDADDFIQETINVTVTPPSKQDATFNFANTNQVTSSGENQVVWNSGAITLTENRNSAQNFSYPNYLNDPLRVYSGNSITISASSGHNLGTITITASDTSYANAIRSSTWTNATAAANGTTVTVTPTGTVSSITMTATAQCRFNSMNVEYTTPSPVAVTGVTLSRNSASIGVGENLVLTATVAPADATDKSVAWTSSDNTVATVSNGTVTGLKAGSATITVTTNDGGFAAVCNISVVNIAPTSITLNPTSLELSLSSDPAAITATVLPSNATDKSVEWFTSDDEVAAVYDGTVQPIGVGNATITARTVNGLTATCDVTVTEQEVISGTAVYTVTGTSSVSSTGTPDGSSATFKNTYTTAEQMTSGKSQTLTLSGYTGLAIDAITLDMHSNGSAGSGGLSVKVGDDSIASLSACAFTQWYDNTSYGTSYRDVHVDLTDIARVVGNSEKITIVISATVNSLYCRAFSVSYTSNPPAHPISITLAENAKTIEKDATYQLVPTVTMSDSSEYTGSVTYTSSNPNVATVSASGLVTAVAKGNATITVRAGNVSTSVAITVVWSNEPLLDSITVSNAPTSVPYKGTLNTSGLVVTAHYTHGGGDQNVTAQAIISQISTNQIGPKTVTVSYTEGNIQKQTSFSVFVTNAGADHTGTEHPGDETTYGPITSNNYFESDGDTVALNGANFTLTTDTSFFAYDNNNGKGSQIGSGSNPASTAEIRTSSIAGQLTSVTVYASTANNGNASISLTVGGVAFKCNGNNSVALTSSSTGCHTFTGSGSGEIVIHYTNSASKAIYFLKVVVTGEGYTTYDWSGDEQAASFITYLQTFSGSCASSFTSRDAVAGLISEYNAMIDEAKNAAIMNQTIEDLGGSVLPINKLKMMVAQYNATLEQGESLLTLNLPGGDYNGQGKAATVQGAQENDFNSAVIAAVITGAALLFAVVIKRKAQD